MGKIDTGGDALPEIKRITKDNQHSSKDFVPIYSDGMTLLDYFAGIMATEVLEATPKYSDWESKDDADMAKIAYRLAAAMIAEKRRLEKQ